MTMPGPDTKTFVTDNIGLACFLMMQGTSLLSVSTKSKSRAYFEFGISPQEGTTQEVAYTMSNYSRFFEAFKYLRSRAIRGE